MAVWLAWLLDKLGIGNKLRKLPPVGSTVVAFLPAGLLPASMVLRVDQEGGGARRDTIVVAIEFGIGAGLVAAAGALLVRRLRRF